MDLNKTVAPPKPPKAKKQVRETIYDFRTTGESNNETDQVSISTGTETLTQDGTALLTEEADSIEVDLM